MNTTKTLHGSTLALSALLIATAAITWHSAHQHCTQPAHSAPITRTKP